MEKGRIEFSISFLEPGGNSEQNCNDQIFFYINSNCVFFKTICRQKSRSPMKKDWVEFSIVFLKPGGNSEQNGNVQIFFSNCVFSRTI